MTVSNCLLARVLMGKDCHKQSFLKASAPNSSSHGWRGILAGRDLVKGNIGKAIGNGRTTSFWRDPWLSVDKQLKLYGPIQEEALDLTVADLLTTDPEWNKTRIEEVLPAFAAQIQALHPRKNGAEESTIWLPLPSGIY